MEDYQLLIDLHKRAKRQGRGGDVETKKGKKWGQVLQSSILVIYRSAMIAFSGSGRVIGFAILDSNCLTTNSLNSDKRKH